MQRVSADMLTNTDQCTTDAASSAATAACVPDAVAPVDAVAAASAAGAANDYAPHADMAHDPVTTDPDGIRLDLSTKTCGIAFPNQEVMQNACVEECRISQGDGQQCAWAFSRSLQNLGVSKSDHSAVAPLSITAALLCVAAWSVLRMRRKPRTSGLY